MIKMLLRAADSTGAPVYREQMCQLQLSFPLSATPAHLDVLQLGHLHLHLHHLRGDGGVGMLTQRSQLLHLVVQAL